MKLTDEAIKDWRQLLLEDLEESKQALSDQNKLLNFDNGYLAGLLSASLILLETSNEFITRFQTVSEIHSKLLQFTRELHLAAHMVYDGKNGCDAIDENLEEERRLLVNFIKNEINRVNPFGLSRPSGQIH